MMRLLLLVLCILIIVNARVDPVPSLPAIGTKTSTLRVRANEDQSNPLVQTKQHLPSFNYASIAIDPKVNVDEGLVRSMESEITELKQHLLDGNRLTSIGDYDGAMSNFYKVLKNLENTTSMRTVGLAYAGLANVYNGLKDYDTAIELFLRALEILTDSTDVEDRLQVLVDLGTTYRKVGHCGLAKECIDQVICNCESAVCGDRLLMNLWYSEGELLVDFEELEAGQSKLEASLKLATRLDDKKQIAETLVSLANSEIRNGKVGQATDLLTRAEEVSTRNSFTETLAAIYKSKLIISDEVGDVWTRSRIRQRYIELTEKLYNEETTVKLAALEVDFMERGNLALIDEQESTIQLSKQTLRKRQMLVVAVSFCVALGLGVVIMLWYIVRSRRITIRQLDEEVRKRTKSLEHSHNERLASTETQIHRWRTIRQELKSELATLKGFCNLLLSHSADERCRMKYQKFMTELEELTSRVDSLT